MTKHNHTLRLLAVAVMMCMAVPLMAQHNAGYEYFIGSDPGIGKGKPAGFVTDAQGGQTIDIPEEELEYGLNLLGIRAYNPSDSVCRYSPTMLLTVNRPYQGAVEYAEYFIGSDPGIGKGKTVTIATDAEGNQTFDIPEEELEYGLNMVGIRTYNIHGYAYCYSPTLFYTVNRPGNGKVEYAEYFWNTDPGYGNGTPVALTTEGELAIADIEIPTDTLHGDCKLYLRTRSNKGWSPTLAFDVSIDAEGNYTLDTSKATDFDTRNFQTLADAFCDFSERGIGGDVVITAKNSKTTYTLDLKTDSTILHTENIVDNLSKRGSILLTATAGSGNTLAIEANEQTMPLAVSLMAKVKTENIAVSVNGTAYNFAPLHILRDEICSGEETNAIELESISESISAEWKLAKQPSKTISGYAESGTGNLPAMTINNSATNLDSLLYSVTLRSAGGDSLYNYTYYIYTHARLSDKSFSNMKPANGTIGDPGTSTLSWTAFKEALGYILTVESKPTGIDTIAPTRDTLQLEKPSYVIEKQAGYTYTWQVTAIGHCDSLTSPAMTIHTRHLPDLNVESISVPEAAEAGNTISVTATIKNNGPGATTNNLWNDKLYYSLDDAEFTKPTYVTYIHHKEVLNPDSSYQVTFSMKVPEQDSGKLYLKVVTDSDNDQKETDNANNSLQSTAVELKPFYMNADDLAALRKLYSDFGGETWSGTQWDITSELIKSSNWSGVTFNGDGRVTAISLQNRNLKGTLSEATAPELPMLTSLNMARNGLAGDISAFVKKCTALTALNMEYNRINDISEPLAAMITSLDLSHQNICYATRLPDMSGMESQNIRIGGTLTVRLEKAMSYDHGKKDHSLHPALAVMSEDLKTTYGTISYSSQTLEYTFSTGNSLAIEQNGKVVLRSTTGKGEYSVMPATITYETGDANISGLTDVNDVQRTLNYITDTNNSGMFNISAANTYADESMANYINVQDIVSTVNIVLESEEALEQAMARQHNMAPRAKAANIFYMEGTTVMLSSADEIAAMDISMKGVRASQVKMLLNQRDFSMQTRNTADGVRIVVFSLTGKTIMPGQTELFRLSSEAMLRSVMCSDKYALPMDAGIENSGPTGINGAYGHGNRPTIKTEGNSMLISSDLFCGTVKVQVYDTGGKLMMQQSIEAEDGCIRLDMGHIPAATASIIRIECGKENWAFKINSKR